MMECVDTFQKFYATPQGARVQKVLMASMRTFWPHIRGLSLLGHGYSLPYLQSYHHDAHLTIASFPGPLGGESWPPHACLKTAVLAEETTLPFLTDSFNRIILVHGLEYSVFPEKILRELYRVLTPEGRMLVSVPNIFSPWRPGRQTPFSSGRALSRAGLYTLLLKAGFEPLGWKTVLCAPPFLLQKKNYEEQEQVWQKYGPFFGDIFLVDVIKRKPSQHYAVRKAAPVLVPTP